MTSYYGDEQPPDYSDQNHTQATTVSDEKEALPEPHDTTGQHIEEHALSQYSFGNESGLFQERDAETAFSLQRNTHVLVKRYSRPNSTLNPSSDSFSFAAAQREIAALNTITAGAVPTILETIDSGPMYIFLVEDNDPTALPLQRYVPTHGVLNEAALKAVCTQLMAALASIFTAGFSHLRLCDETLFISDPAGPQPLQLTIKNFEYAYAYDTEKLPNGLYAAVTAQHGSDIYAAPETINLGDQSYNARKASIWSAGVAIYYMATGQTEYLSNTEHPSFADATPPPEPTSSAAAESSQRRRSSIGMALRRISHAGDSSPGRKSSIANQIGIIHYPGTTRLNVVNWARDIISKMVVPNPAKRAELIEVAAKVPKELHGKETRPLMELAWLDYKAHVGPEAGMVDTGGRAQFGSFGGDGASLFGGASTYSQSFGGWLDNRRRNSTQKVPAYS